MGVVIRDMPLTGRTIPVMKIAKTRLPNEILIPQMLNEEIAGEICEVNRFRQKHPQKRNLRGSQIINLNFNHHLYRDYTGAI